MIVKKRSELNVNAWDQLVEESAQGEITMLSGYLDLACTNWLALVLEEDGEYLAGIALPWKSKLGIKYLYPPFFIQAFPMLGELDEQFIMDSQQFIKKNFLFSEFYTRKKLNFGSCKEMSNYILKLSEPYEVIKAQFSSSHLRNLKKVNKGELTCAITTVKEIIALFRNDRGSSVNTLKDEDYHRLEKIYSSLDPNCLWVRGVFDKNELVCGIIVLKYNSRLCFTFSGNTTKGKETGAMFYLIDQLIQEHADTNVALDFEGSENEGIARFYAGWGAKRESYFFERLNRLPFPLNLLKGK